MEVLSSYSTRAFSMFGYCYKKSITIIVSIILISHLSVVGQDKVQIKNLSQYIGKPVTVCGIILSSRRLDNVKNKPILINLAGNNTSEHLDVIIAANNNNSLVTQFDSLLSREACIEGTAFYYKGSNEFIYFEGKSLKAEEKEALLSPVLKKQPVQEVKTKSFLNESNNKSFKRTVIFKKGENDLYKKELLTRYLKIGHLLKYTEKKDSKTYIILLKNQVDY